MIHLKQFVYLTILLGVISGHAVARPLSVASWNLQWLSSNPISEQPDSYRTRKDIQALNQQFKLLDVDILAFQEVNDIDIARRVVGDEYTVLLSDRSLPQYRSKQFKRINQYTGFAIRKSVIFNDSADLQLTPHSKLRFASSIQLKRNDGTLINIVSVHLKAGCMGKFYPNYNSCQKLKQQGEALNRWMAQQQILQHDYLILGDFNHNLAYKNDWLWQVINQQLRQPALLATRYTDAKCKVKPHRDSKKMVTYKTLIDHIIASNNVTITQTIQKHFDDADLQKYRLSDHCPLVLTTSYLEH
jgi:endonuclease/exonuclease/phosphatase family metal-dependent hydrolase